MSRLLLLHSLASVAAATTLDPNLFNDASSGPAVHRGLVPAPGASVAESLIEPFAGRAAPYARIHRDPQATGATAEAIAAALARSLPEEPKDAAAAVLAAPAPVSAALRYEHLPAKKWPALVAELAAPFGEPNALAEFEGGLLVHAYLSSPGASALDLHEDLGDIVVVQLVGSKTWSFGGDEATLAPGDCLVLPAGTSHVARAEDGPSVHLTLHSIGPDQTSSRRRLSDDDDDDRCFPGTDAYCGECEGPRGSEICEQCIYCTDADTICRSEVPDDYGWPSCCLTVGYEIERAEPCECPGTFDDEECSPDECEDDDDWRYDAGSNGIRGCSWVAKKAGKRCARNLEGLDGRETTEACCATCEGNACEDSDSWYYKKAKKDCGWVSKKSKRCKGKIKSPDGVKSKHACPEACDEC